MNNDNLKVNLGDLLLEFRRKIVDVCRKENFPDDLTFPQVEAVRLIKTNKEITMKDLAGYLKITPPSATSIIAELERKGLIKRKKDLSDRRSVLITLSAKAEKMSKSIMLHKENILKEMLSKLSNEDKENLERIITTLINK